MKQIRTALTLSLVFGIFAFGDYNDYYDDSPELAKLTAEQWAKRSTATRELPKEWDNLVYGGRFVDRFLPIPVQGKLRNDVWGDDNVVPRYVDNGIEDEVWSYWGGNALLGDDGKYHLFICRWREDSPRGHMEWPNSIVVHAVAESALGPYGVIDSIGPGHNPEIFQLGDGRFVISVQTETCYVGENLDGPWEKADLTLSETYGKKFGKNTNLTFTKREDGSFLMVNRPGGVLFSKTGISPYFHVNDKTVYPDVEASFEDPFVWRDHIQYNLIVNDWKGRIAYYMRSKDGVNWKIDPGQAYMPGIVKYEDGTVENWFKFERIKMLFDAKGRPIQAHFAVVDVLKRTDLGLDNHSSKQICIPLTVGRLLTVLNEKPITAETKIIKVKIHAEEDFDPHTDIDLDSLYFGASEAVNFGKGSEFIKSTKSGNDLILVFDGHGNGISESNFAGKLLGRTKEGKLLFGYARLPGIDYLEPILRASKPVITETNDTFEITVEVQNFGQVRSDPSRLQIDLGEGNQFSAITSGILPGLDPFEPAEISLLCDEVFEKGKHYTLKTILNPGTPHEISANRQVIADF